jgi:hypothetical protein
MRRNGKEDLRVIIETEVVLVELVGHVQIEVKLAMNTLDERVDSRVPAKGDAVEEVTYLLCPYHIEHSRIHDKVVFSL